MKLIVFVLVAIVYFCVALYGRSYGATAEPRLAWSGMHKDADHWTTFLLHELNASKLPDQMPRDAASFCPNYSRMSRSDRNVFWAHLVVAMAKRESSYKPDMQYKESFKDAKGRYVISRGLLQISQESANSYGCRIDPASELHFPEINLSCGLKIIERWVVRDGQAMGSPGKNVGCGRYWSVCRSSSGSYEKIRARLRQICS
jgi:hypothetical protein